MTTSNRNGTRQSKLGTSLIAKRSVVINGFKTSISLEKEFWDAVREIAILKNMSLVNLATRLFSTTIGPKIRAITG
jgi:predicted DNA-binding ribbon-helix-helix protein